jgi:hypothetical protein
VEDGPVHCTVVFVGALHLDLDLWCMGGYQLDVPVYYICTLTTYALSALAVVTRYLSYFDSRKFSIRLTINFIRIIYSDRQAADLKPHLHHRVLRLEIGPAIEYISTRPQEPTGVVKDRNEFTRKTASSFRSLWDITFNQQTYGLLQYSWPPQRANQT